jgi:hypothetical protein
MIQHRPLTPPQRGRIKVALELPVHGRYRSFAVGAEVCADDVGGPKVWRRLVAMGRVEALLALGGVERGTGGEAA